MSLKNRWRDDKVVPVCFMHRHSIDEFISVRKVLAGKPCFEAVCHMNSLRMIIEYTTSIRLIRRGRLRQRVPLTCGGAGRQSAGETGTRPTSQNDDYNQSIALKDD